MRPIFARLCYASLSGTVARTLKIKCGANFWKIEIQINTLVVISKYYLK